jgi:hypothetical protein
LLWSVAWFAAAQLALACSVDRLLPQLHDPNYVFKTAQLRRRLQACARSGGGRRPLTILMLGSSRTVFGLDARGVERHVRRQLGRPVVVYNFGVAAVGPLREYLYLERLLAEGFRPDLVLIEVMPPFLVGQSRDAFELRYLRPTFLTGQEPAVLAECGFCLPGWDDFRWQSRLVPWYAYRFAFLNWFAPAWLPGGVRDYCVEGADDWGWVHPPLENPTPAQSQVGRYHARQQYGELLRHFRLGPAPSRALRKVLDCCRAHGIPAALVLMPEGEAFRSWYPRPGWEQVEALLAGLCREYGVPLVNARRWVAEHDFPDSHHLLAAGATRFSARLGTEFLIPWLRATGRAGPADGHAAASASPRPADTPVGDHKAAR